MPDEVVEKDVLPEFITTQKGSPLSRVASIVVRSRDPSGDAIRNSFLKNNPARFLQSIVPSQSATVAHGFIFKASSAVYDLSDEMVDKDPTISQGIEMMIANILKRQRTFVPFDDSDRAIEVRDSVEAMVMGPESVHGWEALLRTMLFGGLVHGFSVNEIIWKVQGESFVPHLYMHRHPSQFAFNEVGDLFFENAGTTNEFEPAPAFKFILIRSRSIYGNPYGQSVLQGLRNHYYFKKEAFKAELDHVDTYGTPIVIARPKENSTGGDEQFKSNLENMIGNLRSDAGLVLLNGEEIEFTDRSAGQGIAPHQAVIKYIDGLIIRELLGATLNVMESEFGSRAASETHGDMMEIKLKPLALWLQDAVNQTIVRFATILNFGDDAPMPRLVIDIEDIVDSKEFTDKIEQARLWGIDISKTWVSEQLSIPIAGEGEEVIDVEVEPVAFSEEVAEAVEHQLKRSQEMGLVFDGSLAEHFSKHKKSTKKKRRRIESMSINRLDMVADEATKDYVLELFDVFEASVNKIGKRKNKDIKIKKANFTVKVPDPSETYELALVASRILSAMNSFDQTRGIVPEIFQDTPEIPDNFKPAVEWMVERKILKTSQLSKVAESLAILNPGKTKTFFEKTLRKRVIALKKVSNAEIVDRVRNTVAASVQNGDTMKDFFDAMNELVEQNRLPRGIDAYMENVYRTESASMYSQQRDEVFADEEFADHLWGYELFNPDDDRSRPTHSDLDGIFIEKGSAADIALGNEPFSYQCRCKKVPIIVADLDNPGFTQTKNALAIVGRVEGF